MAVTVLFHSPLWDSCRIAVSAELTKAKMTSVFGVSCLFLQFAMELTISRYTGMWCSCVLWLPMLVLAMG